ncbi:MAG: toprim domain-containing protein, partial [Candidatus Igneacidithiobacillus chanchocoensis]
MPKSFTPHMPAAMRHPEGRHASLIRKDTPQQTLAVPGHDGPLFVAAEGLETAFSAMAGTGTSGIFALNADGLKNFLAPSVARQLKSSGAGLLVCGDRDDQSSRFAGQHAAAHLVRACRAQGINAWLLLPPLSFGDKVDWNDIHRRAGIDALRAAMVVALENSEKEIEQIGGAVLSFEGVRSCNTPAAPIQRHTLDEATRQTQAFINAFLHDRRKGQAPRLLASDPGTGKSRTLATTAQGMQLDPRSVSLGTVTPTNALADEAAANAEGIRRHGRSENPSDLGHCLIFPDIKPLSDQWRSIVAHRCQNCAHGQAAMESIKGAERTTDAKPCSHLLHISQVRQEPVVSASLAGFEGDPELSKFAGGDDGRELRHLVFDDVSALNDHRMVRTDQIATWVRTAKWASAQGGDEERAALINSLVPDLERLAVAVAGHTDGEQVALDPADWHTLCQGIKDKRLDWMDGTAPEAVHTGADGETEIPLRTLRDLCHAIERGTAWLRKGFL